MAKHNYSSGRWYVTDADGNIRVRQESSDAVLATMEDGGHPELELVPFAEQMSNAAVMAAAPALRVALERCIFALKAHKINCRERDEAEELLDCIRAEQVSA